MKRYMQLAIVIVIASSVLLINSCKKEEPCVAASTANAGADQVVNDISTTLAANAPEAGDGVWTIVTGEGGVIADPLNPLSTFTGTVGVTYELLWTITKCTVTKDNVLISFTCSDAANAGVDQAVEGTTTLLAATAPRFGTGTWSIVTGDGGSISSAQNPASTFTGVAGTTYILKWTISGCDVNEDLIEIRFICNEIANAGPDQVVQATTTILSATAPLVGGGAWSIVTGEGGSISSPQNPASTFTGIANTTYILKWTISGCSVNEDLVEIRFICSEFANAGPDQTINQTSTNLAATTPQVGTGEWSIVSGTGGSISDVRNSLALFTGGVGVTYTLRWTVACSGSFDEVVITINSSGVVNRNARKIYLDGELYTENFYSADNRLESSYVTIGASSFQIIFTYNANGSLLSRELGGIVTKYYYRPTGGLDYYVSNEGNPTAQSKTVFAFANGRISQETSFQGVSEQETGKATYEYNNNVVTKRIYSLPYQSNEGIVNPPSQIIITTFDVEHPRIGPPLASDVISMSYYLPWYLNVTNEVYQNSVFNPAASYITSYEFDVYNRVSRATITYGNGNTSIYTYEY